ncbi:MAG: hypothetical protein K9L30_08390 [Desulfobacterales bacterium]|nr:hypothetical protein [Desulfobacterales bacterium]
MPKDLLIAGIGMAFFIICPRMAGMVHVISKYSQASLMQSALLGIIIAIPLLLAMVLVFGKTGIWRALAFCVLTDIGAAFFMKEISISAGIETLVIAVFVIIGVKIAPVFTSVLVK